MTHLELLAPARTLDIGIAAIDCGADAVYIAAGEFGARQDAGNRVEDIEALCRYAHRYGVRIFVTVNTIVFDEELDRVADLIGQIARAGADALIVQDPAVLLLAREKGIDIPMHASTQCSIRTPERARFLEGLGFSRLVLERELTLDEIRTIAAGTEAEIECFVHGAVCVCYNGQCYLSEAIEGRSANRGCCIQACRSLYDLVDGKGRTLVRNKALLSLKDMNLIGRLGDLADAGATSFKIEGRLKNRSYVMNTVKAYSDALDALCRQHPDRWARSSFGRSLAAFTPDLEKTFNRGYSELLLDGRKTGLSSMDMARSIGEPVGRVSSIQSGGKSWKITIRPEKQGLTLANGDGFCFVGPRGEAIGFRADVCEGSSLFSKPVPGLKTGTPLFRNISAAFEKRLRAEKGGREISVTSDILIEGSVLTATARSEDGREVSLQVEAPRETATDTERMQSLIRSQMSKKSDIYAFHFNTLHNLRQDGLLPLMSASFLNGIRRELAAKLDESPCRRVPLGKGKITPLPSPQTVTYKENVSNHLTEELYRSLGAREVGKAFECMPLPDAELMRSKYCIRYELGMCPVRQGAPESGPLYLLNNGRRLRLGFDCKHCEMTVYMSSSTRSTSPK